MAWQYQGIGYRAGGRRLQIVPAHAAVSQHSDVIRVYAGIGNSLFSGGSCAFGHPGSHIPETALVDAGNGLQLSFLKVEPLIVITSYSIHYTKLYDGCQKIQSDPAHVEQVIQVGLQALIP